MHRVVEIPFSVPVDGEGLHVALVIHRAGPDFVVALSGKLDAGAEVLPSIAVHRRIEVRVHPTRPEVVGDVDALDDAVAGPGMTANLQRAKEISSFQELVDSNHQRFGAIERSDN